MLDDAVVLLVRARQEAWNVDEGDEGDVEGIAEADEAGGFGGGIDVEAACEDLGLICHDSDALAADLAETHDDVLCVVRHYFEELISVEDGIDCDVHVVGLVWVEWDQVVKDLATRLVYLVQLCPFLMISSLP